MPSRRWPGPTRGARLVIVGENRTFPRQDPLAVARDLGLAAAVDVRAWVSDDELARAVRRRHRVRVALDLRGLRAAAARGDGRRRARRRLRHGGGARGLRHGRHARPGRTTSTPSPPRSLAFATDPRRARRAPRGRAVAGWRASTGRGRRRRRWPPCARRRCERAHHRHRQLQRPRRSGAVPRQPARPRRRRSTTRSSSSTTRRRDGSAEAASARPGVRLIALPANVGFAAANNVGDPRHRGRADPAAQQRHHRPARARSTGWSRRSARAPDAAAAGPRLVDGEGRPELSFGDMVVAAGGVAAEAAAGGRGPRDTSRARGHRRADARAPPPGLGQRRVPARPARRRRGGRPARRALLHVPRGRRLLRRAAGPGTTHPVRARRHRHPPARALAPGRAGGHDSRATATATGPSTRKHHPRWARAPARVPAARRAPDTMPGATHADRHRCAQAARLRHRHLPPEPAAASWCGSTTTPSTSCSAAPPTSTWLADARARASGRWSRAPATTRCASRSRCPGGCGAPASTLFHSPHYVLPLARALSGRRDHPRLHPPDVPAVPAQPAGHLLRPAVHVVGDAAGAAGADGVGGVEARHPPLLPHPARQGHGHLQRHRRSLPACRRRRTRSSASASGSSCTSRSCSTSATSSRTRTSSG